MQKITPFLWFDGKAEQAAKFYVSIFKKRSKIVEIRRCGAAGPGPKGSVMIVAFRLHGQPFTALNGGPQFTFSPAISFVVRCQTQAEIDHLWKKLAKGGQTAPCGWLRDQFGVSWQIIPEELPELVRSENAMRALKTMGKINLRALRQAAKKPRAK